MTIKNFRKAVVIAIVGIALFLTGSVQVYLHYYDPAQAMMSRDNLRALSMGAFLFVAEVVFIYGDVKLMELKARGKRAVVGVTMCVVAATMAWTIGSEFASSLTEKKSQTGVAVIEQYRDRELQTATKRERRQVRAEARQMVKDVVSDVTSADVAGYLANFVVALIALVVFQFCDETRRERRRMPAGAGGDQIPHVPGLAEQVQHKIGMAPEVAKAYSVDGGWAIWRGRDYQGFVRQGDIRADPETPAVANPDAKAGISA